MPAAACEFNSRLGYFSKQHCRCDRCPTDFHKVGLLGSIPRPATSCKQRRGWASAQPGLISQDRRVRPPDPLLPKVEYASRQSSKHERLVILQVRLLSRLLAQNDRVVQRLRRLRDKQETDGSIPSVMTEMTRSVSVAAARVCGMDEDRVQVPDGPLIQMGWLVPRRRLILARSVRRVRFPSGPLINGRAIRWATVSGC